MTDEPTFRTFHIIQAALGVLHKYGVKGAASSFRQVLRARWQLRHADAVGAVLLSGRVKLINQGVMTIGDRVRIEGETVRVELVAWGGRLSIGDGTYINYGTNISATSSVSIGRDCAIGQYCIIMDNDHHSPSDHRKPGSPAPIVIEDDVWLGARVIVLRGSHIGRGAVIGANSLVKGNIPPYAVATGSPAKVRRFLREDVHALD